MLGLVIMAIILSHLYALALVKAASKADEQLSNSQEGNDD